MISGWLAFPPLCPGSSTTTRPAGTFFVGGAVGFGVVGLGVGFADGVGRGVGRIRLWVGVFVGVGAGVVVAGGGGVVSVALAEVVGARRSSEALPCALAVQPASAAQSSKIGIGRRMGATLPRRVVWCMHQPCWRAVRLGQA